MWTLTTSELLEILKNEYGIEASGLQLLNGYDDQNFHVKEIGSEGREFLLKVYNEKYSASTGEIEGELELLTALTKLDFPVPRIVPSKSGHLYFIHGSFSGIF